MDVLIAGAITKGLKGNELADFASYKNLGIKFITDDGFDVNDENLLEEAYKKAKESDLIVLTHAEVNSIAPNGVMNEGKISRKLELPGQPNKKEWKAVERGIRLSQKSCLIRRSLFEIVVGWLWLIWGYPGTSNGGWIV